MKYYYESICALPQLSDVVSTFSQLDRTNGRLSDSITDYLASKPVKLDLSYSGSAAIFIVKEFVPIPFEIDDALAQSVETARKVLNYSAQVLASSTVCSISEPVNPAKIQFPICNSKTRFENEVKIGRLGCPNEATLKRVLSIQPFSNLFELLGNSDDKLEATKHFLYEVQSASNLDKHVRPLSATLCAYPNVALKNCSTSKVEPTSKLKVIPGAFLHSITGALDLDPSMWRFEFYLNPIEGNVYLPLLGFVENYTWFLKYVFLPHIFEDLADAHFFPSSL
jgi:hypothetical protein